MDAQDGWRSLDDKALAHMKRLRLILRFLARDDRIENLRSRTVVFGSAAAGKQVPGDIDVLVDFSDHEGSYLHPHAIPNARLLLSVGSQFWGCFDPFVLVGPYLYCRNPESTDWADAKRARVMLAAARASGRPASEVLAEIRARPYELGGPPPPGPENLPAGPVP